MVQKRRGPEEENAVKLSSVRLLSGCCQVSVRLSLATTVTLYLQLLVASRVDDVDNTRDVASDDEGTEWRHLEQSGMGQRSATEADLSSRQQ